MPTPTNCLVKAITEAIESLAEEAMAATSDQRQIYRSCLDALNSLLGLVLVHAEALAFEMVDQGNQIQADLDTVPSAASSRHGTEGLVRHLGTWVEKAILVEVLEAR